MLTFHCAAMESCIPTCVDLNDFCFIRHQVYLNTLNLLLKRGADPNLARVPLPALFFAIMARDTEAVRRLLQSGARTDIPLPTEVHLKSLKFFLYFLLTIVRR